VKHAETRQMVGGMAIAALGFVAGFRDFREIAAWQLAREVKLLAYALLARPNVARDFKFRDQLLDCARSGPRNIAEGFARFKHKEFAQFVRIAKGSAGEVLDHFIDAVDSGYLSKEEFPRYEHACKKALKAINGLIRYLESTPDPPRSEWKKPKAP
jgi:four helix bundle protein